MHRGTIAAAAAYALWGIFPVYWKALAHVPSLEILGHRVVWSLATVAALLVLARRPSVLRRLADSPGTARVFAVTATLIAVNWLVYVWANNTGHIVEASLGYFVTPLVSVVLGLLVLGERLRPGQWLAVALAAAGVAYMIANSGGLVWISLILALSFGAYGLLRKTAPLGSLEGLAIELLLLTPVALVHLLALQVSGRGHASDGVATALLLAGAGAVTAAPLLLFAYGARRVRLVTLGVLQYIAPTLQLLLGVGLYGEAFTPVRLVGFGLVWSALAVYSGEAVAHVRTRRAMPAA